MILSELTNKNAKTNFFGRKIQITMYSEIKSLFAKI